MSWLSSFLHPSRGFHEAGKTLTDSYNTGQGRLNPYNDFGTGQITTLQQYIDSMQHPEKLTDEWNKNYKESEAAKQAETMAQEHGLNAASSMGLMGSNTALNAVQAGTSQIGEQDRQKYLDDLWEKYKTGAGLSSEGVKTGAGVAGTMSQNDNTYGQNSAGLKFGETNSQGGLFGKGADALTKLIAQYLTGGMGQGDFGRGVWSTGGK